MNRSTIVHLLTIVALVAAMAILVVPAVQAASWTVCPGGSCDYTTIQAAVDNASPGDTITVSAGTYVEQVVVNKSLTLTGAGSATTHIVAPASGSRASYTLPESSKTFDPVVLAFGGSETGGIISGAGTISFSMSGFHVDGNNDAVNGPRYHGILVRNINPGSIQDNKVDGLAPVPGTNPETGGIVLYGDSDATIQGNEVSSHTRIGIVANGDFGALADPTAAILENTVIGLGPTGAGSWAQNGIQIGFGATGSIVDNDVSDHSFAGTSNYAGSSILVYLASGTVSVTDNTVTDGQAGIYWIGTNGTIAGNTVLVTAPFAVCTPCNGAIDGIIVDPGVPGDMVPPSPFGDDSSSMDAPSMLLPMAVSASYTVQANNNTATGVTSSGSADTVGMSVYVWDPDSLDFSGSGNTISQWDTGVYFYADTGATLTVHDFDGNSIHSNNNYGAYNGTTSTIDVEGNWWGDASGPYQATTNTAGTGNEVGDYLDYSPWLGAVPTASPMTWGTNDSIQDAIDAASANDTVNVTAGAYTESLTIDKALTLDGAGPGAVALTAASMPAISVSTNNVTIQDMEVTHGTRLSEAIRVSATSDLTVDNVDFTNLIGALAHGNAYGVNITSSFTNLIVRNSSFAGIDLDDYERVIGIYVPKDKPASNFVVEDNEFTNVFVGVYLSSDIDGLTVSGNTFGPMDLDDCQAAASGVYIGDGSAGFDIDNVTVDDNIFTSYCRSVYVWNYADGGFIKKFDITNNTFTNSMYSSAVRFIVGGYVTPTVLPILQGPVTVDGNTFNQNDIGYAGWLALVDFRVERENAADSITVSNNTSTYSGSFSGPYHFAMVRGPITSADIKDNTLNGGGAGGTYTGDAPTSGVYLKTNSYLGALSASAVIDITGNTIQGFENGVTLFDDQTSVYGNLPAGADVNINDNEITGNTDGVVSGAGETSDGTSNWWGDMFGPGPVGPGSGDSVSTYVDYSPWCADAGCTFTLEEGPGGEIMVEPGMGKAAIQAVLDSAPAGTTILFQTGTYAFSLSINNPGLILTFEPNVVFQPSSPCWSIGASVIFDGNGMACQPSSGSDGYVTTAALGYLALSNLEVRNGTGAGDGFHIGHNVGDLRLYDNWVHHMGGDGIEYATGTSVTGVHEVQGNLFQALGGVGVRNNSGNAYDVSYNSWDDVGGPTSGVGVSNVAAPDYTPWTHVAMSMTSSGSPVADKVAVGSTIDYVIKLDASEVSGVDFDLNFDETLVNVVGITDGTLFAHQGGCDVSHNNATGEVSYCGYASTAVSGTGLTVFTVKFQGVAAGALSTLDLDALDDSFAMAPPSGASTNIYAASLTDGSVTVYPHFTVTGRIDLQGRADDTGADMTFAVGQNQGYGPYAFSTSDYWGAISASGVVEDTYDITVEMDRYIDVTVTTAKDVDIDNLKPSLTTLVLKGGDANGDEAVSIADATLIGGEYGNTPPTNLDTDINDDGTVSILDLVITGGNYGLDDAPTGPSSAYGSWTP